jgi:hypothetical protein
MIMLTIATVVITSHMVHVLSVLDSSP